MSEFIGEIEQGIRHALKTVKRVSVPPLKGKTGAIFLVTCKAGIKWRGAKGCSHVMVVADPCDFWSDPDGTYHVIQWEML